MVFDSLLVVCWWLNDGNDTGNDKNDENDNSNDGDIHHLSICPVRES